MIFVLKMSILYFMHVLSRIIYCMDWRHEVILLLDSMLPELTRCLKTARKWSLTPSLFTFDG